MGDDSVFSDDPLRVYVVEVRRVPPLAHLAFQFGCSDGILALGKQPTLPEIGENRCALSRITALCDS